MLLTTLFLILLSMESSLSLSLGLDTLFDVPVSNHGARVRLIARLKTIDIDIKNPADIGGLKSPEYAKHSIHAKMPLLITSDGFDIIESDPICRYLLDKYKDLPPSFIPRNIYERSLSDQIARVHDTYITPIQGCMYKAPGTPFSIYGTNRKAAMDELKRQYFGIENMLSSIDHLLPEGAERSYLCGTEVSLADVTLFPTTIFCVYMLPQFFNIPIDNFLGPRLQKWYNFLLKEPEFSTVNTEITTALDGWKANGRWDPIMKEMNINIDANVN